jgi:ABC-type ATPase involved in cell division
MAMELVGVLKDIWAGGTTVMLATHQARLAQGLKQRTLVLDHGHLVKDG